MTLTYPETYERVYGLVEETLPTVSAGGAATTVAGLSVIEEGLMTLQDQLRGEQVEVADTGTLLVQAADRIDELEALLAAGGGPVRIAALETALGEISAIITAVL